MTSSTSRKPDSNGACSLETRKAIFASGKFSRTTWTAGSVWMISPMDLRRMIRILLWAIMRAVNGPAETFPASAGERRHRRAGGGQAVKFVTEHFDIALKMFRHQVPRGGGV